MSGTANVNELALRLGDGPSWAMVRTHFDIQAFGVNAYIAEEPGVRIIEDHDELGERAGRLGCVQVKGGGQGQCRSAPQARPGPRKREGPVGGSHRGGLRRQELGTRPHLRRGARISAHRR